MNLNNIEYSGRQIQSLTELIDEIYIKNPDFNQYVNVVSAKNGDQVGYIGEFGDMGYAGAGCNPNYQGLDIPNREQKWVLGAYHEAREICAEDMRKGLLSLGMGNNTDSQDLSSGYIMDNIIAPRIERQMYALLMRIGWHGDVDADTLTNGGTVLDSLDPTMLSIADGLWKRIFAQVAINAAQRTTIAANAKTTIAERKAAMYVAGVPMGIIDTMRQDADERIADNGGYIMVTKAMRDALEWDIKTSYKTNMQWETIFSGFEVTQYNGVNIVSVSEWDRQIKKWDVGAGNLPNNPYRAIYLTRENFQIGVPNGELLANLDIFFDRKARTTNIYARNEIGSNIADPTLFQVAY